MKVFSAKNLAQCPNCGEMKPTNATPQQIEEGDWECAECYNISGRARDEEKSIERGQKEISKYDREYEYLVKLVQLVTKEGVPPQEIKDLASAHPFVTVNDIVTLTDQIFTLAAQKYQIPREWLTKKLPKYASLKVANETYDDEWQGQKETQDMLDHAPGYLAYDYGQDKTSKSKKLNIDTVVQILNAKDPKVVNINMTDHTLQLADGSVLSFDDAVKMAMEIDKTGVFSGAEFSNTEFNTNPTLDNGPFSSPEDHGAKPQKQPFPNTNWVPADDEDQDEQPWSNVASSLKPFSKKARMDTPAWIDPNGKIYEFTDNTHDTWAEANADMLKKQYHVDLNKMDRNTDSSVSYLITQGWTRAAVAETAIVFNTLDISHIDQLDDYVAQNWEPSFKYVLIETFNGNWQVFDPFPTLSKGVQKSKRMGKQATIDGQTVNQILNDIHSAGGTTFNLFKGNLSGTPGYSVSVYPDREQVVEGVDFDVLEGYIDANEDLLKDANNSFGAWSNGGKVYLDVVAVIPDREQAINLARQHNQIAIWDLQNNVEIPTGGTGGGNARAFSKSQMSKVALEEILTQVDQNAIAGASSPAYVIAVNNYAEALKRGHSKDRSLDYAIESVKNIEQVDPKKLVEFINKYVVK